MNNKKLEQGPTSKTELCKETDNDFKPLTIFIKCSIVDVGHCSSVFIVDSDIPYLSFSAKKRCRKISQNSRENSRTERLFFNKVAGCRAGSQTRDFL